MPEAGAGRRLPGNTPDERRAAGPARLWVLIDAAGLPEGRANIDDSAFSAVGCLFTGDLEAELADCAPYLALIEGGGDPEASAAAFASAQGALEQLATHESAVLLTDSMESLSFAQAHRHFRKFNVVYGPEGTPLFFRYSDGRVLPSILQVLAPEQLKAFFGPFDAIYVAGQDGSTLKLECIGERLAVAVLEQPLHAIEWPC